MAKACLTYKNTIKKGRLSRMKKIITLCSALVLVLAMSVTLVACGSKEFTVTFDANKPAGVAADVTGLPAQITKVKNDTTITAPTTAPTLAGYVFGGWYKESACTNAWNFASDKVTADTTLFAKWTLDVVPAAVNNLRVVECTAGFTARAVGWDAPTSNGGSAVTGYWLRHSTGVTTWSEWVKAEGMSHTFPLMMGFRYVIEIEAENAKGRGATESIAVVPFTIDIAGSVLGWMDCDDVGYESFNGYVVELYFVDEDLIVYYFISGLHINSFNFATLDWASIGVDFAYNGDVTARVALRPSGKFMVQLLNFSTNSATFNVTIEPVVPTLEAPTISISHGAVTWTPPTDTNIHGIRVHLFMRFQVGTRWLWQSILVEELELTANFLNIEAFAAEKLGAELASGQYRVGLEVHSNTPEIASTFSNYLTFTIAA
jgi:uncharacterized repeat protein (TIGR02543 family)